MSSLRKRRGTWYARVRSYENGFEKEVQVPLKTPSQVTRGENCRSLV